MIRVIIAALAIVLVLSSCGGDSDTGVVTKLTASPQSYVLYAGQTTPVGQISVWNNDTNLYVKFDTYSSDWQLTETHLSVVAGTTASGVPQKNGNPIPGKFDYKTDHEYVKEFTYTVPLAGLGTTGASVSIAAHASAVAPTELLVNEGFEQPALPSALGLRPGTPSDWDVFADADIPGWNITWTYDGTPGHLEYWRGISEANPKPEGAQVVELDSDGRGYTISNYQAGTYNNVKIAQTLTDLSGECFLSFAWSPRRSNMFGGLYDCQMEVGFNGAVLDTFSPANYGGTYGSNRTWDYEIIPLNTVGLTSAELYFKETGVPAYNGSPAGSNGGYGTLLDKVSVLCYGNGETAWSTGSPFNGSNWATYSVYTIGSGS